MKIIMVAGGTGGHIYPALALAEALENKGHEITFVGSNDRMEKDLIPSKGYKYIGLDVYSTIGNVFNKLRSLYSIIKGYFKCLDIVKDYDMAIGFGNYISIPVILAAYKHKLKVVLHEQNSYVGKANKLLDKKADLIIGCYKENLAQFKNKNIQILGNPQASKAYNLKKNKKVLEDLGLDPNKKTITIFMGSLGSYTVNKKMLEFFNLLDGSFQVVYAAGENGYLDASQAKTKDFIKIFKHIDGANVMKNSDLLICRAGATTLAEISAIGIPSIIIPSPYVANNHQYYNGLALKNAGAAILIEEKDLDPKALFNEVNSLIHDDATLKQMAKNALKLGNPKVMDDIILAVESL